MTFVRYEHIIFYKSTHTAFVLSLSKMMGSKKITLSCYYIHGILSTLLLFASSVPRTCALSATYLRKSNIFAVRPHMPAPCHGPGVHARHDAAQVLRRHRQAPPWVGCRRRVHRVAAPAAGARSRGSHPCTHVVHPTRPVGPVAVPGGPGCTPCRAAS